MPQHIVAPSTSNDPNENENPSAVSSVRSMLDSVISAMATHKQATLAEQARLKEQATKEQESKAKSIKDKQQPKDNTNKKSKP